MSEQPKALDAEVVPEQALVVRQSPGGAVGILRPADNLDAIAQAFKEYQAVCERILTADDYQKYEGKPRKKKSAWRKLATAFNVSTEIMDKEVLRDGRNVIMAEIRVRAFTPGGRQAEALASCDVTEKCCAGAKGHKCHKAAWKGHYCCQNGCDGRKHWSHPDHDIISTAQTRATNRAIADLIGCGEVSAEELTDDPEPQAKTPPQHTPITPKPAPAPASAQPTPAKLPVATEKTRQWMLDELKDCIDLADEFFHKLDFPAVLLPNERIQELGLRFVPVTKEEMRALKSALAAFGNGEQAGWPYKPHDEPFEGAAPLAETVNKVVGEATAKSKDPEWWRDVIVPIPPKGIKRDIYLKNPQTIGELFDMRHGSDDESQAARQRLWGFVNHFEPKGWTKRDGTEMPPSETDIKFREALDAFWAYFEREHPNEKL